jgi:hypothetical protein
MASVTWTVQIYLGAFPPIHWGFNPRVSPDRSNDYQVFQSRYDGSDKFLTCVLSHDSLDMERSYGLECSHGPWGSTVPTSSLPTKTQKVTGVRNLTSYFLLPNLTVMNDHRFSNEISFVDQHLSRSRYLSFQLLLLI